MVRLLELSRRRSARISDSRRNNRLLLDLLPIRQAIFGMEDDFSGRLGDSFRFLLNRLWCWLLLVHIHLVGRLGELSYRLLARRRWGTDVLVMSDSTSCRGGRNIVFGLSPFAFASSC